MRALIIASTMMVVATAATPLLAQDSGRQRAGRPDAGGYVTGMGGFASSTGNTTGDALLEAGVRIAPHVMVIGNVGYFRNLQTELQPVLDTTTSALSANQGLTVIGGGTLPAWYSTGGLRIEVPTSTFVVPYVLYAGVARLNPTAQFTFSSGVLPDGTIPDFGQDVTSNIEAAGAFSPPAASTAFMFTLGGGVQLPVARRVVFDVGYRYSRIAADQTLSASPLNTNGMTFGLGYRF